MCLLENIFALCPFCIQLNSKFRGGATLLPFLLINIGAPKNFHWSFHRTVPLAAPHVSLSAHSHPYTVSVPKANTRWYSSSFFPRTALLWNSLPVSCFPATYCITCLNSNATSIVIVLLFDFLFPYPLSSFFLALTLSGLLRPCDWQLPIKKNNTK